MAQYPGSVPAFATIQDGVDYPQAAHINDRQIEITAIADALKNGIPHLVTISTGGLGVSTGSVNIGGPTSLATLQVNGASTFAGAVTFGAAQTFSGLLTASSGITVSTGLVRQNSLPAWDVYGSTFVGVPSGSTVGISFDVQEFVRGNIGHSTTTTSSRVTLNSTGLYHVQYTAFAQTGGGGQRLRTSILFNDATVLLHRATVTPGVEMHVDISGLIRLTSTGYLTVQQVSSNGASTHGSSAAVDACRFTGWFLG